MSYTASADSGESDERPIRRSSQPSQLEPDQLRIELERLMEREREIVALLHCKSPDRILHDLRNLLNEVQLLRVVADDKM